MKTIKYLAIIPARGGSKRIPHKNILMLNNKPLIAWSINAAINCNAISETIISTDDLEIASVAVKYGANVPFFRPIELSSDTADSINVVLHAINHYKRKKNTNVENIILLQPTSPLRTSDDISKAIQLFEDKKAYSVISVCPTEHSILWCNTLPEDLSMKNFINPQYANIRSQDLPTYYRLNGAIYITKTNILIQENSFFSSEKSFSFIMPTERSVDIDNEIDFDFAELVFKRQKSNG